MTVPQGAAEADFKIRTPFRDLIGLLGLAGVAFASAAFGMAKDMPGSVVPLVLGCVFAAEALWLRSLGVDLLRESATVRGARRRSIPWQQVQAVLRDNMLGADRVSLILESGEQVRLRAPTTFFGLGAPEYEHDFQRIGQWWLAHRGESWSPCRPELQA